MNGSTLEVESPIIVHGSLTYENISLATSSKSCSPPKAKRKRCNVCSNISGKIETGIHTQEDVTKIQEQKETYYMVSYLKNNVEHEIFSAENVAVIEPDPARPALEFVLKKKGRDIGNYFLSFQLRSEDFGRGLDADLCPRV